jgi:hypothetical protein
MPNYIKNRIELIGSPEDVQSLIDLFSTHFERTPKLSFDGEQIFTNKETGSVGWLDTNNGVFKRRDLPDVNDVPEGFEQDFDEAWTRFPDFNKIVPMPKGLEANPHSGIQTWIEICTGQIDFTNNADQSNFDGLIGGMKKVAAIRSMTDGRNLTKFSDEELDLFVQGVKNFRDYGFVSWYDWSCKYWGTKWNSSECKKYADNVYDFTTAWSGVPDLIEKMSKAAPLVKIIYKYSDEDTGHNCGIGEYQNGVIYFNKMEGGSKESYEMAFELRPDRKENYKLVDDGYEYVESEEDWPVS